MRRLQGNDTSEAPLHEIVLFVQATEKSRILRSHAGLDTQLACGAGPFGRR